MKFKNIVISLIAVMALAIVVHDSGQAEFESAGPGKIGVISVRKVFAESARNQQYRAESAQMQEELIKELEKQSAQLDADLAALKTYRPDSDEYSSTLQKVIESEAALKAKEEFHKQQFGRLDHNWTQRIYSDILKATEQIAAQRGLDIVLEAEQPQLPASNANDLMLTIRTSKVLYAGPGCVDITEEVTAAVDQMGK